MNEYDILMVDDDEGQRHLTYKLIEQIEIPNVKLITRQASCYDEAVEAIKEGYPDLVILDVMLVGLSGLYIAAYISGYAVNHDLKLPKILFVSGGFDNKDKLIEKAKLLGASFLWKPVDTNVFKDHITKVVLEKYPTSPPIKDEKEIAEIDGVVVKVSKGFTKDNMKLLRDLEHYVAHMIMELQFFRTKSRDMLLGPEEEEFLHEMEEIESKALETFARIKEEFIS